MADTIITSSLIKALFHKGESKTNVCYRKVYAIHFEKARSLSTPTQSYGLYFETMALGSSARGEATFDLPRKPGGVKTSIQARLDDQLEYLKKGMVDNYIQIIPDMNTQTVICKRWDRDIILCATLDIFPTTIFYKGEILPVAAIDLKVTKDLDSNWGDYSWGAPEHMDHTQLAFQHYIAKEFDMELNHALNPSMFEKGLIRKETISYLNNLSVFYWVFEYGTKMRNQIIKVNMDSLRLAEVREVIRKTVAAIDELRKAEWPVYPSFDNCRFCPLARHNGGMCLETNLIKEV